MPILSRRNFLLGMLFPSFAASELFALDIKGIDYMPISELARTCGMRYKTISRGKTQTVYSKYSRMVFSVHDRNMKLNDITVWLGHPIAESRGMLYISRRDFRKSIAPILYPQNSGKPPTLFTIVLDAGHGGKDNGTQNSRLGVKEKSVALDITMRLSTILKSNGYKVLFTRKTDKFVELSDRSDYANKSHANLFVSIHCNAASNTSVSGIETFAVTPQWMPSTASSKQTKSDRIKVPGNDADNWSQLLSYYIQRSMRAATGSPDRGVKRARFAVLKSSKMPSTLIEVGFLSNSSECKKLATPSYRQKIAESIASGIMTYHRTLRRLAK